MFVALSGCTLPELDLTERQCPCAAGWVCSPFNVCVPVNQAPSDAGTRPTDSAVGVDSGIGPVDGGTRDDSSIDPDAGATPDSGAIDAAPPKDDSACVDDFSAALICHSYDLSFPGSATQAGPGAVVSLSAAQSYRGTQSLYAETGNGIESAFIREDWAPAVFSDTLYARAFVYFPSNAAPDFSAWGLLGFKDSDAPFRTLRVELNNDYVAAVSTDIGDGASGAGTRSLATDQWLCIQLTVSLDDNDGSAQLHVDGELYAELTGADTRPLNGFTQINAGVIGGAGQGANVFIDELVVDTSPTPCE